MAAFLLAWGNRPGLFRLALILAALAPIAYTIAAFIVAPSMDPDAGWGFLAWRSMQAGAAFNTYYTPDPADLSKDIAPFLAWWSPGQYLVPGVIGLTGLKVGQAIAITAGLSLFAFLSGTAVLMRRFGQPPLAALLAVLFLAAFRFSSAPFSVYTGGEILILAALPWFVLASLRVPEGRLLPAAVIAFAVITLGFLA